MTDTEMRKIRELRLKGTGYKAIASVLGISRDIVRNYCRKNGLDGEASVVFLNVNEQMDRGEACCYCGKKIRQPEHGRPRRFCSEQCRRLWWKEHPEKSIKQEKAFYSKTCLFCGKEFQSYGNKNRKYCSHNCYIKDRFWRDELNGI